METMILHNHDAGIAGTSDISISIGKRVGRTFSRLALWVSHDQANVAAFNTAAKCNVVYGLAK